MEEPTKVIIYCRVSSKKQVKEGNGLDSQEQSCRSWARQRGYEVERVFQERGISGSDANRPAFNDMLNFLFTSKTKYIVLALDINRFARDVVVYGVLRNKIRALGHQVQTVNMTLEDTEESELMENVSSALGQYERKKNAARTKNCMIEHSKQGYWVLQPPTGYHQVKINRRVHLQRTEPTATYLQTALEGFASGKFQTQTDVYNFLASCEIIGPYGKPINVTMNFVKNLLTNEKYTGWFSYPQWDIPYQQWYVEPIICVDTFKQIQDKLHGKRGIKPHKYNVEDERFPLRRFVRCAVCGQKMTASRPKGKSGKRFEYYHCHNKQCPMCGKGVKSVEMHTDFEQILADITPAQEVINLLTHVTKRIYNEQNAATQKHMRDLESDIAIKEQTKQDTFNTLIASGSNPEVRKMCEERISALTSEIAHLKSQIQEDKQEQMPLDFALGVVREFVERPLQIWRVGGYKQQQGVLNLCFDEPVYYERGKKFRTPKLSPIFAVFSENLGDFDSWRAQKDSNPQPSDP